MSRMRQERLQQQTASADAHLRHRSRQENGRAQPRISLLQLLAAILFTLIAALPLAWGVRPSPYYLGYQVKKNIYSRVDFSWNDPEAEERALGEVERRHHRIYVQANRGNWMDEVFAPTSRILETAATMAEPKELVAFAQVQNITLKPEQARLLIDFLQRERHRVGLFQDLIDPVRRVLDEDIFARGVLSEGRYAVETAGRGNIIAVLSEPQAENGREVRVAAGNPESPIGINEIRYHVNRGYYGQRWWIDADIRKLLTDMIVARAEPTLIYNEALTRERLERARRQAVQRIRHIREGDLLVSRGNLVTEKLLRQLRREEETHLYSQGWEAYFSSFAGKFGLLLGLAIGFLLIYNLLHRRDPFAARRLLVFALIAEALLLSTHLLIHRGSPASLLPLGILAGIAALASGRRTAFLAVSCLSLMLLVLCEGQPGVILSFLSGGWLFAYRVPRARYRLELLHAANLAGVLALLVVVGWGLSIGETPAWSLSGTELLNLGQGGHLLVRGIWAYLAWIFSSVVVTLLLPLVSGICGATTNIRLQDLLDQDHPLLRRLVVEAPSTYQHSVIVSTLAEAGAETIHANALLAKVGCLYHDVGKLGKPEYFNENESGISRHDNLKPSMSALIIIAHVKDGLEMARQYRLPRAVLDVIGEHHGQTVVKYFYHRAQQEADAPGRVEEARFRYPGPMPRSSETALVMMADSVEAASRSLDDASPAHLRSLVHGIIMGKLMDGQLAETTLTLADLKRIEDAFVRILASMFHSRVRYPGQAREGERRSPRS